MTRVSQLLNAYSFPLTALKAIKTKKTEKGIIKALSTLENVEAIWATDEDVFQSVYNARRLNANDKCSSCGCSISANYKRIEGTKKVKCGNCGIVKSPLVGTPLQQSRCKMDRIILCVAKTIHAKIGYTSASLSREMNWKYDTTRKIRYRSALLMKNALDKMQFNTDSPIEVDEYYPPIPSGLPKGVPKTRGLGSEGVKSTFVAVQRGGLVKAKVMPEINQQTLKPFFESSVTKNSTIYSDGAAVYNFLSKDYDHHAVNHREKIWAIGDAHVNEAESFNGLSKNQIKYIHLGVSERHLQKYVSEMAMSMSHRFTDIFQAIENIFTALPPL